MKKKKSLKRRLHDLYSGTLAGLGVLPRATEDTANAVGLNAHPLVTVGESFLDNGPEHCLHGAAAPERIPHRWPARELCHIRDAWLAGDQGQIFLRDGSYLRICPSLHRLDPKKIRRPIPVGARRLDFPVFHLTGRDHENHGHFLLQHLPRWQAARHLLQEVQDLHLLVPPGHLKWQRRYLEIFGVDPQRVIEGSAGTIFCRELYYVPMLWQDDYLCAPSTLTEISDGFRRLLTLQAAGPKAVWVSRSDAPDKKLINEASLIDIYRQEVGEVEELVLSKTPLQQQIDIVGNARLVIGAQGQGLTTGIFARNAGLIVLEAGERLADYSWCAAYRDMAIMTGNPSLRLISGGGRDAHGSWTFPEEKFRAEIGRAVSLV